MMTARTLLRAILGVIVSDTTANGPAQKKAVKVWLDGTNVAFTMVVDGEPHTVRLSPADAEEIGEGMFRLARRAVLLQP